MTRHITIEDRLEIFAQGGLLSGFTLKLWDSKAKILGKQGIVLRSPKPTGRKGEKQYEVDFSVPIPGTFSEALYNMAMESRLASGKEQEIPSKPLCPPYSLD